MDNYNSDEKSESQRNWIIEKYGCSKEEARIYMSYWLDGYPHWQCLVQAGLADPPF